MLEKKAVLDITGRRGIVVGVLGMSMPFVLFMLVAYL